MSEQVQVQVLHKPLTGSSPRRSLLQRTCVCGQHTIAGGECSSCRNERLASSRLGLASTSIAAPTSSSTLSMSSSASHFHYDFSQIPVHTTSVPKLQRKPTINEPEEKPPGPLQQIPQPKQGGTPTPCQYPTAVTLVKSYDVEFSSAVNRGQICAHMRVLPSQNLCAGKVQEHVTPKPGASCPDTLNLSEKGEKRPLCAGSATFPFQGAGSLCQGLQDRLGPTDFADAHGFQGNVLNDDQRNPKGLGQCHFICSQYYSFKDSQDQEKKLKGNFEIRYDFKRVGKDTHVTVSKKEV